MNEEQKPKRPFAIGSSPWPGIAKLGEETGEVQQVIGKLVQTGGHPMHWDGSNLVVRLENEMGDVLAAIEFVTETNTTLSRSRINARFERKLALFRRWHEELPEISEKLDHDRALIEEDMVERAVSAFGAVTHMRSETDLRTDMRAALNAALHGKGDR